MSDSPSRTVADELRLCCPTPVLRHGRLLIKNDGETGLTYGGNKVRKLTPLFSELLAAGTRRVLTMGAAGSHHVLANALFASRSGLSCAALLFRQPYTAHAADVFRRLTSLEIKLYPCFSARDAIAALVRERAQTTAWTGPGAIGPCAASGYETAFDEWFAQRPALDLQGRFEHHVVAAGSGGTAAGLLTGLAKHRLRGRVVAVAVNHNPTLRALILGQAWGVQRRFGRTPSLQLGRALHIDRDAVGGGYGHSTPATFSAIEQAREVGLHLEHTYTAKAYSVALELLRRCPDDVVVFWQTLSQRPQPRPDELPAWEELPPALRRLMPDR